MHGHPSLCLTIYKDWHTKRYKFLTNKRRPTRVARNPRGFIASMLKNKSIDGGLALAVSWGQPRSPTTLAGGQHGGKQLYSLFPVQISYFRSIISKLVFMFHYEQMRNCFLAYLGRFYFSIWRLMNEMFWNESSESSLSFLLLRLIEEVKPRRPRRGGWVRWAKGEARGRDEQVWREGWGAETLLYGRQGRGEGGRGKQFC